MRNVTRLGGPLIVGLAFASLLAACSKAAEPAGSAGASANGRGGGQTGGGPGGGGGGAGGRGGRGSDRPTPVEIETVRRGTVARTSMISGMVEAIRTVGVNAQISGILLSVRAEEGRRVGKGEVLATIDAQELEAQSRSAEASLTFAKATLERSERLFKQQIVTAAEFDRDRAAYESAKASSDQLKTRVGFSRVVAPASGMITEKRVEAGDIVSTQTRLFTVADVSTLVTRVQVSELEVATLRVGDKVPVTIDALGGEQVEGRIRRIFPAADSSTRLVPVEVALASDKGGRIRPGYSVRATFALDKRENALLVPSRAVTGPAGARAVFVVQDGQIARRPVKVGTDVSGNTEVFDGIIEGDSVIVSGTSQLREGAKAKVVAPLGDAVPAARVVDSTRASTPGSAATRGAPGSRGGRQGGAR
ncbi:MAG: efflux RND transporter periplasmic adaptor subunit [Gemmatimonadaceae bacterium]|nr:efflux RND transporter periplasmic adaptor subunit [Gemmatimonadaceae bacterium]